MLLTGVSVIVGCDRNNDNGGNTTDPDAPFITITNEESVISLSPDEQSVDITYQIENPVAGTTVEVDLQDAAWIELADDAFAEEGTVTLNVLENREKEPRSVIVTLSYGEAKAYINLIQEESSYYVDKEAGCAYGFYMGKTMGTLQNVYYLYLADNMQTPDGNYGDGLTYVMFLFSDFEPEDRTAIKVPASTYVVSTMQRSGVMYLSFSSIIDMEDQSETGISSGKVTIGYEGDQMTAQLEITDENDNMHRVSYTGDLIMQDESYLSTMTENVEFDFTTATAVAYFYGDVYNVGLPNYNIQIENAAGQGLQFDLVAPASGDSTFVPDGTYRISDYTSEFAALSGVLSGNSLYGSWFYTLAEEADGVTDPMTPLMDGTVKIVKSGDDYIMTLDVADDKSEPHRITGTGTVRMSFEVVDLTQQTAPAGSKFKVSSGD